MATGRPVTAQSEIVWEFLRKFPKSSKRGLANLIAQKHPDLFTFETARSLIRIYRGTKGKWARKNIQNKTFYEHEQWDIKNPFGIPLSEAEENKPFVIPPSQDKIGIISDLQFPYHCPQSINTALKTLKERKVNTIIINGDYFDFYSGSSFAKDPRRRNLAWELKEGKKFLHSLFEKFRNVKFYFKIGNHEARYERYLTTYAPLLLDMEEFRLDIILEFKKYGCEVIKDKQWIKAGKLNILHGHEMGRGIFSPVNPARSLYLKVKDNSICGHFHQVSAHSESDINGKVVTTWSMGCLCYLRPDFMPINKWQNGFAYLETEPKEGNFIFENKTIIKGRVY
jgi:predicted phosphodiesterase